MQLQSLLQRSAIDRSLNSTFLLRCNEKYPSPTGLSGAPVRVAFRRKFRKLKHCFLPFLRRVSIFVSTFPGVTTFHPSLFPTTFIFSATNAYFSADRRVELLARTHTSSYMVISWISMSLLKSVGGMVKMKQEK